MKDQRKEYDPLACIPSAGAVQKRLAIVVEEMRRLMVLLHTAQSIEGDPAYLDHLGTSQSSPISILDRLTEDQVRHLIASYDAEKKAAMMMLRFVRARDRARSKNGGPDAT